MICKSFKALAQKSWETIQTSKAVSFQLKEETLTDFNLLYLKIHSSKQVITHAFNKSAEGVTGADWEWWFTDGLKWMVFRVQAKIINNISDEFEHLHYQGRASIPQSEKLILEAERPVLKRIPLYCLYMATDKLDSSKLAGVPLELYGCSLLSAYRVRALRSAKVRHVAKLQADLLPWHQLVCGGKIASPIDHLFGLSMHNFLSADEVTPEHYLTEQPPAYVLRALRATGDNLRFEEIPVGLAGIMIVDISPEQEVQQQRVR